MKKLYYDFEVYPNFWLVVFKDEDGKKITLHSRMDYVSTLKRLLSNIDNFIFVGFNNSRYDRVMLNYLLQKFNNTPSKKQEEEMFQISKDIIYENKYYKQIFAEYMIKERTYEMDVSTFLGVGVSLKEIGCRLHHPKLETLPIPPEQLIKDEDIPLLEEYCENDVDITIKTDKDLVGSEMQVVTDVIDYWGLDRKYMDSSVGNIVEIAMVDDSVKNQVPTTWRYRPPVNFNFKTQEFKDVEETYKGLRLEPGYKFNTKFDVDNMEVSLAMGGAHGAVRKSYYKGLIDIDIDQYYPQVMVNFDFIPNNVKDKSMLSKLIEDKKHYGKTNDPRREPVKKSINSFYGRMGYEKSRFYSPNNLYQVTITGQLLQLRLIEDLRAAGFEVVYLNTDGLTIVDNGDTSYSEVTKKWADEFGLDFKEVEFNRAYYRDVNNFVAEDNEGNLKRKGDMDTSPSKKNSCFARVSVDAVVENLMHGTPIREYIYSQHDIRDYLMYHKYNKDMRVFLVDEQDNKIKRLPNVVRYYLAKDKKNAVKYDKGDDTSLANRSYNKNITLVNEFKDTDIPKSLNKEAYVHIAFDILEKMTGEEVEDNPYIEGLLSKFGVEVGEKST